MQAIGRKAVEDAKAGDARAREWVSKYLLGDMPLSDGFLTKQGVKIEGHDLRRLHDKMLKWIEGIPIGQVLVIKLSGLTGKPNVYSSYQPKGRIPVKDGEKDA